MEQIALLRVCLVYGHLLLCVFALHTVLRTDWRLLRSRIGAGSLLRAQRSVTWLFAGLWASGLLLVALDTGFDPELIAARPKLLAKLACVGLLTVNGVLLRAWCFPRLASDRLLGPIEAVALMCCGAISTTSWLMAALYGVARGLDGWSLEQHLAIYAAALAVAMPVALSLAGRLRRGRAERLRLRLRPTVPGELGEAIAPSRRLGAA